MNVLYPELEPFATDVLELDDGHSIYFEQSGNEKGLPVIFFHGGPGSGCNENHRRYFNPDKYRIIIFDQRGCHRSTPNGSVENNSTQDLLNDIESIRNKLNIEKLMLYGGSWGATLALLYAEHYPQRVSAMILRGIFLARQCDFEWFANNDVNNVNGVNRIFPDYWQEYLALFDESEKDDLLGSLHRRVFSENRKTQLEAAKAWSLWAGRVVTYSLGLNEAYVLDEDDEKLINEVKVEMHYAKNKYFIKENQILDYISQVPDVPITIIHGRKDLTCLPESSWSVHQALPNSELIIVADAGHLASEPAMIDTLVTATDQMVENIS
ncbi:MAG: prolyl aminopeptidase [Proteobacteria bacterium]|nr:prolyl aminopeptidase [Pseudomonadota bacterium]